MGYRNLVEWEKDLEIFRRNPNDIKLLEKIVKKVNKTEVTLKSNIEHVLKDIITWNDPVMSFQAVIKDLPEDKDKQLIIYTEKDPWFKV